MWIYILYWFYLYSKPVEICSGQKKELLLRSGKGSRRWLSRKTIPVAKNISIFMAIGWLFMLRQSSANNTAKIRGNSHRNAILPQGGGEGGGGGEKVGISLLSLSLFIHRPSPKASLLISQWPFQNVGGCHRPGEFFTSLNRRKEFYGTLPPLSPSIKFGRNDIFFS